jgi:invasion protein IalB
MQGPGGKSDRTVEARPMKIVAAALVFFAFAAGPALAQTSGTAPASTQLAITGWRVECDSQGTALNCRVTDQVAQSGTGALIGALGVALATDTKKPVLTLQLPLGLAVSDPVTLTTDGASQAFSLITCDRQGCFARAPIDDALLAKMRLAKQQLQVHYNIINATLAKQTVTLALGLDGFDAALTKIK